MWMWWPRLVTKLTLWLLGAERRVTTCGPVRLAYYRLGPEDGEPWLLVHGLGSTAASWAPLLRRLRKLGRLERLRRRRPVSRRDRSGETTSRTDRPVAHRDRLYLIPEMSALGGTEAPGDAIDLDLAPSVLRCLIDHEAGKRPTTVVGISLGTWMSLRLALGEGISTDRGADLDGDRDINPGIERLILIAPTGFAEQDWERILSMVRVDTEDDAEAIAQITRLLDAFYIDPPWPLRFSKPTLVRLFRSPVVAGLLDRIEPGHAYTQADLAKITCPSAVIWGEHDGLLSPDSAAEIAEALRTKSRFPLAGSAHALGWENPAGLADAIERFLDSSSESG